MEVIIENKLFQFENSISEVDKILGQIEKEMYEVSKVVQSLIIDDIEIYNDYNEYLVKNIKSIENIRVTSSTYKELLIDTLESGLDYLKRVPEQIELLAESYYNIPSHQSMNDLGDLLGGIRWLIDIYAYINTNKDLNQVIENYSGWNLYGQGVHSLNELLPDFENALSSEDNVTIADILSYEVRPKFDVMADALSSLLSELE